MGAPLDGPPIFHGGTIPDALRRVRELAEPLYIQLKDPFTKPEQQIVLNGHDKGYTESVHKQQNKDRTPLKDDDFNGFF